MSTMYPEMRLRNFTTKRKEFSAYIQAYVLHVSVSYRYNIYIYIYIYIYLFIYLIIYLFICI